MRVAIYTRVSTEDQDSSTQRQQIIDYCKSGDFKIYDIYEDVISGKTDSRPAFDELMRDKRFNTIIVYKLDRIGGSLQHLLQLFQEFKNKSIDFISITQNINTTTPEGKLMLRMLMILAEYERELIVARTKDTLDRYQKDIEKQGYFTDKEGKKHKTLGRPKGSKDSRPRPKSGYYHAWAKKREKAV